MIHIRPLQLPGDTSAILRLGQQIAEHHGDTSTLTPEFLARAATRPGNVFLVAEHDRAIAGYIFLQPRMGLTICRDSLHVDNIVTDAAHRRLGVGRALIIAAARATLDCGATSLTLAFRQNNPGASAFYQAMGFTIAPSKSEDLHAELSGPALQHVAGPAPA